jgi:DNA polymerase-1
MTEATLGPLALGPADFHDTYVESRLIYGGHKTHRLKDLAWELAGIPKDDESAVKQNIPAGGNYSDVPADIMAEYQKRDVARAMLLHLFFYPKIVSNPAMARLYETERALILTTRKMENRGFMVNFDRCQELVDWLQKETSQALDDIARVAGRRVNPNKEKELHWLLFTKCGLPIMGKTPTGKPSTKKDEFLTPLRKAHPIIDLLMKYRSYARGISIVKGYMTMAGPDGILHPDINTYGAITGRESCSNPNLQNVSKEGVLLNPFPIPARRVFRPRPGFVHWHVDYAGIEMRLAVFYSREQELIDIIRQGGDVHFPGAELFFGDRFKGADKATKKILRGATKNANFGIIYGAGAEQVAESLGLSKADGARALALYRQRFPKLTGLNKANADKVKAEGRIVTAFGRVIPVPKDEAFLATNYLIQGTAADIIKVAQVRADKFLEQATGDEVRILLPIHDELIIEFPRARLKDAPDIYGGLTEAMTGGFDEVFDLPLEVEAELATTDWANKKALRLGGGL